MFALKPTFLTIISLVQQIKQEKAVLASLNQKLNNLQQASVLLNQNAVYLDDINNAISSSPSPDVFIKQIRGLAAKNNVLLTGLAVNNITLIGNPKTSRVSGDNNPLPENANEMGYSISIKGGFNDIGNFLKDLENLRVISTIDGLTINSSVTDTGRVIVAVISGRVPYLGGN
jgi:Tfp pilus assembly protein PilO